MQTCMFIANKLCRYDVKILQNLLFRFAVNLPVLLIFTVLKDPMVCVSPPPPVGKLPFETVSLSCEKKTLKIHFYNCVIAL